MKIYLILNSSVFLWYDDTRGILYDTASADSLLFRCDENINRICNALKDPLNLYSIEITPQQIKKAPVRSWIDEIVRRKMGFEITLKEGEMRPGVVHSATYLHDQYHRKSQWKDPKIYKIKTFASPDDAVRKSVWLGLAGDREEMDSPDPQLGYGNEPIYGYI